MNIKYKQKLGSNFYAECYLATAANDRHTRYRAKVIKPKFVDEGMKAYLYQRLSYMKQLDIEGLCLPELIDENGQFYIQQAFDDTETLSERLKTDSPLSAQQALKLGISLCESLDNRHKKTWVHKGIKPNNILYSPDTDSITLLDDLSFITPNQLSRLIYDPSYCTGSLPYQSPEQCGQVRLDVDYRSDLYSLGCVLYHCIAGSPPFSSSKPQDIIHSHLAELPVALHEHQADCPRSLSNIVATLLEKQAEKRYRTANGLKKDLSTCLNKLIDGDHSEFLLKSEDSSSEIALPSILFGRDDDKGRLLDLHSQVCTGKFGVAFVSGLSGIGKSRLVQELEVPLLKQHALFASGKYNQFSKHQPYATIAQAIGKLIRKILTEPNDRLENWKNKILDVVGINGQLLTAVIPELTLLIGPQPAVNPLPPVESRQRFNDLFCRFMTSLATKEHPFVLFIDDLQWCDDATLNALDQLFAYPERHPYLLLIIAFRSNEITEDHPIWRSIDSLQKSPALLMHVELVELNITTVNEMTAYILNSSPLDTLDITKAIHASYGGNPLLISESLRWLHQKGHLKFNQDGQWHWDASALTTLELPESFLSLLGNKLSLLSPQSQNILSHAALLGARVKTNDLAELLGIPLGELMPLLSEIYFQRILTEEDSELCFSHDQIQKAAQNLLPPEVAAVVHQKVAQLLIRQLKRNETMDHTRQSDYINERSKLLYAIAGHLKESRNIQTSPEEAFEEATINALAGECALHALAHSAADYYFSEAALVCTPDNWDENYDFMLALHKNCARSALLIGEQGRSNTMMALALKHASNDLDRADCLLAQTIAVTSLGKISTGMVLGLQCCKLLQRPIPDKEADINNEIQHHVQILGDPSFVERYQNLPAATDRKVLLELAINAELLTLFYLSSKLELVFLTGMRSTVLASQQGKSHETTFSFAITGSFFHFQKHYELASNYQRVLLEEAKKAPYEFSSIRGMLTCLWLTMHHSLPLNELEQYCLDGIENGMRGGELNFTGLTYIPLIWYQLTKGENIENLKQHIDAGIEYSEQFDIGMPLEVCTAIKAALMPLWGPVPSNHQQYVESKLLQWREKDFYIATCNFHCFRAMLSFYTGNYVAAEEDLTSAEPYLSSIPGSILERLWYVYRYLVGLHTGNNPDAAAQLVQVREWTAHGAALRPYCALMEAETIARNCKSIDELRIIYWRAIDAAHEGGYYFHEAYAYQRLGMLLDQHKHHSSGFYINEAVQLYKTCHAGMFAKLIVKTYDLPLALLSKDEEDVGDQGPEQSLDSEFLLAATETIMKERNYDTLLLKILSAMMERVGAKNAYLITLENENLRVRAHGKKTAEVKTFNVNQDVNASEFLCAEIVRFAARSQSPVVLQNASTSEDFCHSQSVQKYHLKSVLALPLLAQGHTLGVIFLENSLIPNVFDENQASLLQVLTSQAATALDNTLLINNLQETQETLISREQNLATTLNSIGDGVIVTDQLGHIVRLNPVAEKLTGWTISEAKGQAIQSIFHIIDANSRERLPNPAETVLSKGETIFLSSNTTLISRDGAEYQIADSAAPIRNGDEHILGMVLVFNDETEAYRLRKEVVESHLRLQQIMGDMHAMVATLSPDGRISFVNKRPLSLGNLNLNSVQNQYLWDTYWFAHDDQVKQLVHEACTAAAKGQQINHDIQIQTLDGPMWIEFGVHPIKDNSGTISLLVSEGRDIASRKLAERQLKDEQALQALTLDNLADAVIICDNKGLILRFNKAACHIFEYEENNIVGKSVTILMCDDNAQRHETDKEDYLLSMQPDILGGGRRVIAKRKSGELFPLHITVAELPELISGKKLLVASAQDLTDRELQQEMLHRSQKMDALGKLTGGIAHDYNNMLGVILGYTELLDSALSDMPKQQGFLHQIKHAAERGVKLTQKLLSYSRQKPSQTNSVNINNILLSQKEMLEKTLTARIQLQFELNDKAPSIDINVSDLEDAILNLCINAMHAMPEGGILSIKSEIQVVSNEDATSLQIESGDYMVISITDTGFGMDKATQNRIFDPFFSTKGEMGTGLGLSQVYGFMERSRGAIKIYSELDYGSRFSLYFPVTGDPEIANSKSKTTQKDESFQGSESILVVDDEQALVALIQEILQRQGYNIFCANSAQEAMTIIKSEHIDLVLSDIIMPKVSGYQLAKSIHKYNPEIPIQLMSGFDNEFETNDVHYALHSGQLTKPIKTLALLRRVKELLNEKRTQH
ncbi:MAG: PAS domain S-box protein [Gammaproteobacteria bacterium]|nr:PAS domain S-box protein [Gammaproteobacteria bacterium]